MFKNIFALVLCFSVLTLHADEPSRLSQGLNEVEAQLKKLTMEVKSTDILTLKEAQQVIEIYDKKITASRKQLEGLKQQYAAEIQDANATKKMAGKAVEDMGLSINEAEAGVSQTLAVMASLGVIKKTLEEFKAKETIAKFSMKLWDAWDLSIKGNFKNFPPEYLQKDSDSLNATVRMAKVDYVDRENKQTVSIELNLTSFLRTLDELKKLLQTGIPTEAIQATLKNNGEEVNFGKGEKKALSFGPAIDDYYYSLISIHQTHYKTEPSE